MLSKDDWEAAAGERCAHCGELDLRILDGLCRRCYAAKIEGRELELERKTEKRQVRMALARGDLTVSQLRRGDY